MPSRRGKKKSGKKKSEQRFEFEFVKPSDPAHLENLRQQGYLIDLEDLSTIWNDIYLKM
jgi:hypothetical protein